MRNMDLLLKFNKDFRIYQMMIFLLSKLIQLIKIIIYCLLGYRSKNFEEREGKSAKMTLPLKTFIKIKA